VTKRSRFRRRLHSDRGRPPFGRRPRANSVRAAAPCTACGAARSSGRKAPGSKINFTTQSELLMCACRPVASSFQTRVLRRLAEAESIRQNRESLARHGRGRGILRGTAGNGEREIQSVVLARGITSCGCRRARICPGGNELTRKKLEVAAGLEPGLQSQWALRQHGETRMDRNRVQSSFYDKLRAEHSDWTMRMTADIFDPLGVHATTTPSGRGELHDSTDAPATARYCTEFTKSDDVIGHRVTARVTQSPRAAHIPTRQESA